MHMQYEDTSYDEDELLEKLAWIENVITIEGPATKKLVERVVRKSIKSGVKDELGIETDPEKLEQRKLEEQALLSQYTPLSEELLTQSPQVRHTPLEEKVASYRAKYTKEG